MKTICFFLTLMFAAISVCHAQEKEYSFKESYPISGPAQLKISSSDGNIEVVPTDASNIQVFWVVKKGKDLQTISRRELEQKFTIIVEHAANRLSIQVKHKEENSWMMNFTDRLEVGFSLHVPKTTSCELRTSDGNISIKGLTSNQKINTSDGNIRVSDVRGNVSGRTSDGNLVLTNINGSLDIRTSDGDIKLEKIMGNVQTSTSDGNIRLTGVQGAVELKTSDGDINFKDLKGSLSAATSDGNIRGNITELQQELVIKTGDGSIDVVIPAQLGLDLNIKGENLSIPLANFSGRSDENSIQGKMNGGGIAVNLSTGDGQVNLNFVK